MCVLCCTGVAQRQAACPLCRAPFPPDLHLAVNCELKELMRLAEALTAVEAEGEEGWQAVTSSARRGKGQGQYEEEGQYGDGGGQYSGRQYGGGGARRRVEVGDVLEGSGSVMELDPQPWEADSSSAVCRSPGCSKPFSFMLRPRHHCRSCGQLFCGACTADRMLLPPKFRLPEPQRVCRGCAELLVPIQPLLAGSISPAVRQPVHDVHDWSAPRSLFNSPFSARLETDLYTATNILRQYVRTVGSLPQERCIPPAILRGCAGLAILSVAKAGAGWSLSVGSGLVVARLPHPGAGGTTGSTSAWSAPSAIISLASSVGWQLGLEVQDVVLVLRSEAALRAFTGAQLGIGGSLSVAAGPVGRAAAARALASTASGAVVYSYCAARGAFAGLALEAMLLSTRDAVNQAFYGRKVTARQLLISGAVPPPPAATALYSALDALLEHAGDCEASAALVAQQAGRAAGTAGAAGAAGAAQQDGLLPPPAVGLGGGSSAGIVDGSGYDEYGWEASEGEEVEEALASAPPVPAHHPQPHHSLFHGLGGYDDPPPARATLAAYPQLAPAQALYPSLDPIPYGNLFD